MKGNFSSIVFDQQQGIKNIPIVNVVEKCGVHLLQSGTRYKALCPFHGDKETPSLVVTPETNSWVCYGASCLNPIHPGKRNGGSAIDFVMQTKHLDFQGAIYWLSENFNLQKFKKETGTRSIKRPKILPKISNSTVDYYYGLMNLNDKRGWFKERGFNDNTIDNEALGFDGENHVIPIWKNEPRTSDCLCLKLRQHGDVGAKYIRLGSYLPWIYNYQAVRSSDTIYLFAGELDALLAYQDGLPACSVINGAKSISELGENWPNTFFPNAQNIIIIFDRKEALAASLVATDWERYKGKFTSEIFHWVDFGGDDYTDYRIKFGHSFNEFKGLLNA